MRHLKLKNGTLAGHYFNKHESKNLLIRAIVKRYRRTLELLVRDLPFHSGLEIGSGEGYILSYIRYVHPDVYLVGSDISIDIIKKSRSREFQSPWCVAKAENLPFVDKSFDLLIACEVLEHVPKPELALSEMQRVTREFCLVSVPNEPLWRILNILRAQYLHDWGNTPGHIQHWSVKGITELVSNYFRVVQVRTVLPWIFVLAATDNSCQEEHE